MLDRIDFETCALILEHYDDLTQGQKALNIKVRSAHDHSHILSNRNIVIFQLTYIVK